MSYASIVQDHLSWLATVEGDDEPETNAVRVGDSLAFTLTLNEDVHGAEQTEAGTYEQAGRIITGFTLPTEITPVIADVVVFNTTKWRITDVDPQHGLGGAIVCHNIRLAQMEAP